MKQLSLAALSLALFSLAPVAGAQTTVPTMTVDEVTVTQSASMPAIAVTGVVQGDTSPSTRYFRGDGLSDATQRAAQMDRCHRSLLLALSKPGQYVAKMDYSVCNVARVAP